MSAQGRGYTYSYREALTILGNGDSAKGRAMLDEFVQRLVHARTSASARHRHRERPRRFPATGPFG